eukprot:14559109-Heterocapsa_arctica.AAC.1
MAEDFSPDYGSDGPEPELSHLGDGRWCFDVESISVYLLMLNSGYGQLCSYWAAGFIKDAQNI